MYLDKKLKKSRSYLTQERPVSSVSLATLQSDVYTERVIPSLEIEKKFAFTYKLAFLFIFLHCKDLF